MDRRGLTPAASQLVDALVNAFPGYVERRLREQGLPADGLDAGALPSDLERELSALLASPPHRQDRSPLEVVRDLLGRVTTALVARGVKPASRDEAAVALHPEDRYALYPASSRELGEEAWRAHLEWGFEKARLVAGVVPAAPSTDEAAELSVALFGIDRPLRDSLADAAAGAGYRTLIWRNPAAVTEGMAAHPTLTIVALDHPAAHDTIRTLAGAGLRVIAVANRVDDLTTAGIMALGAEAVLESGRILGRFDALLPRLV